MILDTLITDRTAADVARVKALSQKGFAAMTAAEKAEYLAGLKGSYNATDLNRVGEACEYVANRLNEIGGFNISVTAKQDWQETDIPTAAQMAEYVADIARIRAAYTIEAPDAPLTMQGLTYQEANEIEQILILVDAALERVMGVWVYSNQIYAGQVWTQRVIPRASLVSIAVTTAPTKKTYNAGEVFNPAGMVVTATYADGSTAPVTDYTYSPTTALTTSTSSVTITYTEGEVTKTTTQAITVVSTSVTAILSGTGNTTYCYATINGTKRYGTGTYTVTAGSTITFGVYGYSSTYYGRVTIDGNQKLNVTDRTTQIFEWTVPNGISRITIQFTYTSISTRRNGRIVVTTS